MPASPPFLFFSFFLLRSLVEDEGRMSEVTVYARCVLLECHDGVAVAVAIDVDSNERVVVECIMFLTRMREWGLVQRRMSRGDVSRDRD